MGAEAGEQLGAILARKEEERSAGKGVFFWGIGTALGQSIWDFVNKVGDPHVLFSPIRSKPKLIDLYPVRVVRWNSYVDRLGAKHPLPAHVFVTSRTWPDVARKRNHYALVCKREVPLNDDLLPQLHFDCLANLNRGSRLGFSQVTAVVERDAKCIDRGRSYQVMFSARLTAPYFVRLADPVDLEEPSWNVGRRADDPLNVSPSKRLVRKTAPSTSTGRSRTL